MPLTNLRRLSEIEAFYAKFKVSIHCYCELLGNIIPDILQQALDYVASRHPLLAARIRFANNHYYFTPAENAKIALTVSEDEPLITIHQELNNPLPEEEYLFRALLLNSKACSYLITTLHHAVADATCCMYLQKEILQTYAKFIQGDRLPMVEPLPLMPALEKLLPDTISNKDIIDYIARFNQKVATIDAITIPTNIVNSEQKPIIHYFQKKWDAEQTQELIKKAKAHKTTVHATLCAAHLLAVKKLIAHDQYEATVCCYSPIDVRRRVQPPISAENMFSAAIGANTCYAINLSSDLWSISQSINQQLKVTINSGDLFKSLLAFSKTRSKFKMPIAFGITNVGVIDIPQAYANLALQNIYFIPAVTLPMLMVTVATFKQQLILTYPYVTPYYSLELIENISCLTLDQLLFG